eukprot:3265285-Amphidinium_carterae.1
MEPAESSCACKAATRVNARQWRQTRELAFAALRQEPREEEQGRWQVFGPVRRLVQQNLQLPLL